MSTCISSRSSSKANPGDETGQEKETRDPVGGDEYVPFMDDGDEARSLRMRTDGQAPFLDIGEELPQQLQQQEGPASEQQHVGGPSLVPEPPASGVVTNPGAGASEQSRDDGQAPLPLTDLNMEPPPGFEDLVMPTSSLTSSLSGQPETEASPEFSPSTTEENIPSAVSASVTQPTLQPSQQETSTTPFNPSGLQGDHIRTETELRDRLIDLVSVGNLRHKLKALFALFRQFMMRISLARLVATYACTDGLGG